MRPVIGGREAFSTAREEWNGLAVSCGSPYLTHEWLAAWWSAFGVSEPTCILVRDGGGSLEAAGLCASGRARLRSPTNPETGDWGVLARDESGRRAAWEEIASLRAAHVRLERLSYAEAEPVAKALRASGYRIACARGPLSPWRSLPSSPDELMTSVSPSLRSQFRRRRRGLERLGRLSFRIGTTERDLEVLLALEASGWKRRAGTAIVSDPRAEALYRDFAATAAARGWVRFYLLELDGRPIAADFGCAFAGRGYLLKTGFDETYARLSPGFVLRGEVLKASIEEGLQAYDFLGGPDPYKLRWGAEVRPRVSLWGYRGLAAPGYLYRARIRPRLRRAREAARRARV